MAKRKQKKKPTSAQLSVERRDRMLRGMLGELVMQGKLSADGQFVSMHHSVLRHVVQTACRVEAEYQTDTL